MYESLDDVGATLLFQLDLLRLTGHLQSPEAPPLAKDSAEGALERMVDALPVATRRR
jgi:hypothetical protein